MSKPVRIFWPLSNTAAVCALQTIGAAGAFSVNGILAKPDENGKKAATFTNIERVVSITSAGNVSAVQFTITGMYRGASVSETRVGPNATTVYTTQRFTTVTSVTTNAAVASNTSIGTGLLGNTVWYQTDYYKTRSDLTVSVFVNGGVVSYTFETTPGDPFDISSPAATWTGIDGVSNPTIPAATPMINATVSILGKYTFPTSWSRIIINASDAATNLDITFLSQGLL